MPPSTEERVAMLEVQSANAKEQLGRIDGDLRELVRALNKHEEHMLEIVEESREQTRQLQRAHDTMGGVMKGFLFVGVFVAGTAATISHSWSTIKGLFV